MELTAQGVYDLVMGVLYKPEELVNPGEAPPGAVIVQGARKHFGFHPERLKAKKEAIRALLNELPDDFMLKKGGGMSFLNLCLDRHGRHWGEHTNCDDLLCLGLAVGMVTFCLPREDWKAFPGGMPYIAVDTDVP